MTLIAIGGAEDKTGDMTVLRRVLAESGLKNPRVLVVTSATGYPADAAKNYGAAFGALGADCHFAHVGSAHQAKLPEHAKAAAKADIIFFTGGDQSRLMRILGGSAFMEAVVKREAAGGVIAGTSAGAMAMSALMITSGNPARGMLKGEIGQGVGLGLAPKLVIDTHVGQRDRLSRLFNVVAGSPAKTGIALDEDTAIILRGGKAEVVGRGHVTIVTGEALHTNYNAIENGTLIRADHFTVNSYRAGAKFRL